MFAETSGKTLKNITTKTEMKNEVTNWGISVKIKCHLAKSGPLDFPSEKKVFFPRVCSIAFVSKIIFMIIRIDQDLPLTVQTSFVYLLRWGF